MEYDDIHKVCKRYSFDSKIRTLNNVSFNLFNIKQNSIELIIDLPFP